MWGEDKGAAPPRGYAPPHAKQFKTMAKEVHVILKGDCYSMNTYCSTLKEFLEMRNLKRSDVSDWWNE